jgi:hypothetical protein
MAKGKDNAGSHRLLGLPRLKMITSINTLLTYRLKQDRTYKIGSISASEGRDLGTKQSAMLRTTFQVLAWASILAIVIVTDGPIGLRPITHLPGSVERFFALLTVATLFTLAYPNRLSFVGLSLVLAVFVIEFAQIASLGRHARLRDAGVKVLGVFAGLALGYVLQAGIELVRARIAGGQKALPKAANPS